MTELKQTLLKGLTASLLNKEEETANDPGLVNQAKEIIKKHSVDNEAACFLLFAAFNYLNAAVKRDKAIGYWFKGIFSQVVPLIEKNDFDIEFYLNKEEQVLYVEFEGCFQFSFHNPNLKEMKSRRVIEFDDIRKQRVAGYILSQALLFMEA